MFDKLEDLIHHYEELMNLLSEPDVANDANRFKKLMKEQSDLAPIVETYKKYKECKQNIEDSLAILDEESDEEMRELAKEELKDSKEQVEELEKELKILLLPKDPNDDKNVIVEIRAGAGGEEAALFAAEIYRMYVHYAENRGWKVESALDAIEMARSRCFKMKWVIEFDIVGLFDNISHEKLLELVEKHCHEKWVLMYIDRCLKTPILMPDKTMRTRNSGTPQGGVISPVLANLFMHYAFDSWMAWKFPKCPWERYADDGIIHCVTRKQAEFVLDMLKEQMMRFGLGIDTEQKIKKKELRDQQSLAKTTEKAIKKDPLFKQYYLGKMHFYRFGH